MGGNNILAVNGVWLPSPSGLEVTYNVLDKYAKQSMDGKLSRKSQRKTEIYAELAVYAKQCRFHTPVGHIGQPA